MTDAQKGACSLENDNNSDRAYEQKNDKVEIQNMGGGPPFIRRPQDEPLRNVPPFMPTGNAAGGTASIYGKR